VAKKEFRYHHSKKKEKRGNRGGERNSSEKDSVVHRYLMLKEKEGKTVSDPHSEGGRWQVYNEKVLATGRGKNFDLWSPFGKKDRQFHLQKKGTEGGLGGVAGEVR